MYKELFELKNTYELLGQLNTVAYETYTNTINKGIQDLDEIRYFLLCLDRVYQEGFESPLRDNEYDAIYEMFVDAGGEIIRGDMSSGDKAKHLFPSLKGTIRKVHYITEHDREQKSKVPTHKSLESWINKTLPLLDRKKMHELGFYIKYDGLSIVLSVKNGEIISAITRGDKELGVGQDKTEMISRRKNFKEISDMLPEYFGLKCEVLMGKDLFKKYNEKYGNNEIIDERSAVSSILNSDNPTDDQFNYLYFQPLMISVNGIECPIPLSDRDAKLIGVDKHIFDSPYKQCETMKTVTVDKDMEYGVIKDIIDDMTELVHSKKFPFPCDGIVIRYNFKDDRDTLGRNEEECINDYEIAYKFPPATKKTKILNIEQSIGYLGKVSFVAKVEPVTMKNKTIKSISMGSLGRFEELHLAPGDEVLVQYDIIPYITVDDSCKRISPRKEFKLINTCPYCGQELVMTPELSCVNKNCPSRIVGRIYNYCTKMHIENIGPNTIETLFNEGILTSIEDLYRLDDHYEKLVTLDGFGPKSIQKLIKEINKVKKVDFSQLLGSIGINGIGPKIFKNLAKVMSFDEIMDLKKSDIEKLCNIPGIKEKTAMKIIDGINDNRDVIEALNKILTIEFKAKHEKEKKLVCFSKVRNSKFEKYLYDNFDLETTESLNKNVSLLIVDSLKSQSGKIKKAIDYGIPIIEIGEMYKRTHYEEE